MNRRIAGFFVRVAPVAALILCAALGVALASEGGGHGGGTSKLLDFVWRLVNFVILVVLLWKLLADKVKTYFIDRRDEIAQMIDQADKAKADAQAQYTDIQQKLREVEKDVAEIRAAIMGELDSEKARIIEEGKTAAERIVQQAKWTAEQEVLKAKKELKDHVVEMAADMASGIVTRNITPEDQKRILEEYLDKVAR
jgi:F-type H+-transporting ATPase subunit b